MRLTARKDESLDDDYVDVKYRELTPTIHQILQICEDVGSVLLCEKDGATHRVDANDVLYIEWVDSKSFVYTKDEVFTMPTSLNRLEETLKGRYFVRSSRMALINIYKIKSVSNGLNFRLVAEMVNGEKLVINRYYRGALLGAIQELAEEVTT